MSSEPLPGAAIAGPGNGVPLSGAGVTPPSLSGAGRRFLSDIPAETGFGALVEGFVAAYGDPGVPEAWRDTVKKVLRQRLSAHEHPQAVADALRAVPRSRAFEDWSELGELGLPALVVASRDEPDPGHPYAVGERYAREIPGAELVTEDAGASPLAWQGGQLSKLIAALAARAAG